MSGDEESGSESSDHDGDGVCGTSSLLENATGEIARVTGVEAKWTCLMAIACDVRCFNADLRTVLVVKVVVEIEMIVGLGEDASVADSSASSGYVAGSNGRVGTVYRGSKYATTDGS